MKTPRTPRARFLSGTATGVLALGLLAAVPGSAQAAPGDDTAAAARADKPQRTFKVSNERQLRIAALKSNRKAGKDRIKLTDSIRFDAGRPTKGGSFKGDIDVRGNLVVVGNGRTIDAADIDRVFDVREGARLTLRRIRLTDGAAPEGGSGGAVRNQGTFVIRSSSIARSVVTGAGASGGAIMNEGGTVRVVDSALMGNDAVRAGGAIEALEGTTTVKNSTLRGNTAGAEPGNGGAIHLTGAGTVNVTGSRILSNTASAEGGGLWNSAEGTLSVSDTMLRDNAAGGAAADQGGGALYNDGGTLTVTGSTITDNDATGAAGSGGGILNNLGDLDVTDSTLANNTAPRAGGAIEANVGSTTLTGTTLDGNSAGAAPGNGGGLHLTGAGTVDVTDSTVTNNTASAEGGGLWNSAVGTFTVTNTTLTGNTAGGAAADQGGGALYNDGGSLTVTGSTFTGNDATGAAGSGGGILNNLGALSISDSTLSGNTAVRAGGGVETNVGTVTIDDVDMTDNSTGDAPGNGGALHLTGAAVVTWSGGTVTGNDATNEGGGLWNSSTGTLTATVTISDNTAPEGPNAYNDGGTFVLNGTPIPPMSGV